MNAEGRLAEFSADHNNFVKAWEDAKERVLTDGGASIDQVQETEHTGLLAVRLIPWLPRDSWYCSGVLFIRRDLPASKILGVIAGHLTEGNSKCDQEVN